jgi:hypothetical protein
MSQESNKTIEYFEEQSTSSSETIEYYDENELQFERFKNFYFNLKFGKNFYLFQ